jgi:hypothetical protein
MSVVAALAAIAAVAVAIVEIRSGIKATKVERVIDLHRDLTTGEVGAARDRFTTLMWKHGERLAGRNRCHAPTWGELLPDVLGGGDRGLLGEYRSEDKIPGADGAEPMRDLYSVLWCLERIEAGRAGRALDLRMMKELIASHAVWWDELTQHLIDDDTRHIASLRRLAANLGTERLREWARADFADARS